MDNGNRQPRRLHLPILAWLVGWCILDNFAPASITAVYVWGTVAVGGAAGVLELRDVLAKRRRAAQAETEHIPAEPS